MATCAHCGYESEGLSVCPLCGGTVRATPESGAEQALGVAPAGELPPWEDGETPFPQSAAVTWWQSVLEPGAFFRGVPYEKAAGRPILYYLLISVFAGLFTLFWTGVASGSDNVLMRGTYLRFEGAEFDGSFTLFGFFLTPFAALIGLFIGAAVLHLFVLIIARKRRTYGATVRIVSYASGPLLFQIVPVVGTWVGSIWSLVLIVTGIREAHRTTTGGAVAVVVLSIFIPVAILFVFAMCVALALAPLAG